MTRFCYVCNIIQHKTRSELCIRQWIQSRYKYFAVVSRRKPITVINWFYYFVSTHKLFRYFLGTTTTRSKVTFSFSHSSAITILLYIFWTIINNNVIIHVVITYKQSCGSKARQGVSRRLQIEKGAFLTTIIHFHVFHAKKSYYLLNIQTKTCVGFRRLHNNHNQQWWWYKQT